MIKINKKLNKLLYIIGFYILVYLSFKIFWAFAFVPLFCFILLLVEEYDREFLFWGFLFPFFWMFFVFELVYEYLPSDNDIFSVIFLLLPIVFLIIIEDKYKNIIP